MWNEEEDAEVLATFNSSVLGRMRVGSKLRQQVDAALQRRGQVLWHSATINVMLFIF